MMSHYRHQYTRLTLEKSKPVISVGSFCSINGIDRTLSAGESSPITWRDSFESSERDTVSSLASSNSLSYSSLSLCSAADKPFVGRDSNAHSQVAIDCR